MASSNDNISMAVFCDFENVALGVRDANYEKFDIKPVLERLLLKGSIVVKKAYCDWERYKGFKATMHEANFELIEIPHVRQSGKNSADIRLVVDALDLCYTKSHVNTFVIISGDSDFSPLVSKLRENAKQVIGVGVKQSTSDLLVANCDEFIFYDDLVREVKRAAAKRDERKRPEAKRSPDAGNQRKEEMEARKAQAIELVVEMFDALVSERGDSGKIWASLLKDTLKRRRPDFNETYYGFRTFGNLLEEAQSRGMLEFGRDEKSGAYVYRSSQGQQPSAVSDVTPVFDGAADDLQEQDAQQNPPQEPEQGQRQGQEQEQERAPARSDARRRGGRGRNKLDYRDAPAVQLEEPVAQQESELEPEPVEPVEAIEAAPAPVEKRRSPRGARKSAPKVSEADVTADAAAAEIFMPPAEEPAMFILPEVEPAPDGGEPAPPAPAAKAARKPAARGRRPAKPKAPKPAASE